MRISFLPCAALPGADTSLTVVKTGDLLTINGDTVNLSGIPDGASLPAEAVDNELVIGTIERIAGVLHITLRLPYDGFPSQAIAFPADLIDPPDGPIAVPHDEERIDGND